MSAGQRSPEESVRRAYVVGVSLTDGQSSTGRRLFEANDSEWTGLIRFWAGALNDQSPCGTTEDRKQTELSSPMGR